MPEMAKSRSCSTMLSQMTMRPRYCHRADTGNLVRRQGRASMTMFDNGRRREGPILGRWVLDAW